MGTDCSDFSLPARNLVRRVRPRSPLRSTALTTRAVVGSFGLCAPLSIV
jgi:hypothetical protein